MAWGMEVEQQFITASVAVLNLVCTKDHWAGSYPHEFTEVHNFRTITRLGRAKLRRTISLLGSIVEPESLCLPLVDSMVGDFTQESSGELP